MTGTPPPPRPYAPPETEPQILHADDWLIVADKPAGLLSVPGRGAHKLDSALSRLARLHGELHTVHRLDMDTSGLIIFARHPTIARTLSVAFQDRRVAKTYAALVHGCPERACGEIGLPIGRDWAARPLRRIDRTAGKPALTRWSVLRQRGPMSLLKLKPVTGRTHQLRLHLAAIGHPIAGDRLYGDADCHKRLHLHACSLTFQHPETGARIHVTSPSPFAESSPSAK